MYILILAFAFIGQSSAKKKCELVFNRKRLSYNGARFDTLSSISKKDKSMFRNYVSVTHVILCNATTGHVFKFGKYTFHCKAEEFYNSSFDKIMVRYNDESVPAYFPVHKSNITFDDLRLYLHLKNCEKNNKYKYYLWPKEEPNYTKNKKENDMHQLMFLFKEKDKEHINLFHNGIKILMKENTKKRNKGKKNIEQAQEDDENNSLDQEDDIKNIEQRSQNSDDDL